MIAKAKADGGATKVTFRLESDRPVSVVGDFNDWRPGAHTLVRRRGDLRSVAVVLPRGEYRFRYLVDGGDWRSDPDADAVHGDDSVLVLP